MRKFIFGIIGLLCFSQLHAQIYSHGHLTVTARDSMYYDSTQCNTNFQIKYDIIVDSSYTGQVLLVKDTSGTITYSHNTNTLGASPWVFTISVLSNGYPDFPDMPMYVFSPHINTKVIAGADTLWYIPNYDSVYVSNPCEYGDVTGSVFIDANANCIFDSGEVGIDPPGVDLLDLLSSPVGSRGPVFEVFAGGNYSFIVQQSWMISYSVFLPTSFAFIFPYSPCFTGYAPFTTLPQYHIDFPLLCTSNVDVQCYALSPQSVRLHTPFYMRPYVSNTGCDTAAGQLTLVKDSRVTYDPGMSTYPANLVYGDTLVWNYHGLSNLSSGAYWNSFLSDVYLTPGTTLVAGDTLCFRIYTNIPAADANATNNDYSFCLPAVYSYDPNEKEVSPKGTGPQGYIPYGPDTLTYSLRFQNTGTASAYDVSVIDTLDAHFNATTLKILGTSHNMTAEWLAPRVVRFNYNNIMLPDSTTDEAASHGEVRFSVALNTGVSAGTEIRNTGYIYFDANPAVQTNTTLNTIEITTNINHVAANVLVTIYPNPATDHIVVEHLNSCHLSILDLDGRVVLSQDVADDKMNIDVSGLSDGVYILKTVSEQNTTTLKFTKY